MALPLPLLPRLILTLCLTTLLTGCPVPEGWFEGDVRVRNDDPSASIVTIYISRDCEDSWGNVDAQGLSIPPGGLSQKFERDTGDYDIRACFDSGTCGDRRGQSVEAGDTHTVGIIDEGTSEANLICY